MLGWVSTTLSIISRRCHRVAQVVHWISGEYPIVYNSPTKVVDGAGVVDGARVGDSATALHIQRPRVINGAAVIQDAKAAAVWWYLKSNTRWNYEGFT